MICSPFNLLDNIPTHHHGVVFVDHVVAMHDILPGKIAETYEKLYSFVGSQIVNIFAAFLMRRYRHLNTVSESF